MDSSDKTLFARIGIGLVALATIAAICWVFDFNMRKGTLGSSADFSLAGEWNFHNGPLEPTSSLEEFSETVKVPEPLKGQIKEELKEEFWYQKTFLLTPDLVASKVPLALFLGSIKGDHEIFWNGRKIHSGEKTSLSLISLNQVNLNLATVDLRVKIKTPEHLFPGIVHVQPMGIGMESKYIAYREFYYFDSGAKPLIFGIIKIALFFLFGFLFLTNEKKSEYFSFSIFVLFAGLSSVVNSRFLPFYGEFYFRNALVFYFTVGSFSILPWLSGDVLRLSKKSKFAIRLVGLVSGAASLCSLIWISSNENRIYLYQLVSKWLPILVGIPSVAIAIVTLRTLSKTLAHRKWQIFIFSGFLTLGVLGWFASAGSLLNFNYIPYSELWDIGLFMGLAISTAMDMNFSARRSDRAGKVVPKWFSVYLASGAEHVTLELPMVAIAVDTVGYTRLLSEMDSFGKSELHAKIRSRMAPVMEKFGAQKLSDRGDGALFAWDLSGDSDYQAAQVRSAIAAAEHLVTEAENSVGIKFRVGVAAGIVRGEMKGSELSFLGEPLNAASRLEAAATPGSVLLHDSVTSFVSAKSLSGDWIKIEVKGVSYKAVALGKAA